MVDEARKGKQEEKGKIITRIGKRSKMIVCGDDHQVDLKNKADSGFRFIYKAASKVKNLESIKLLENHRDPIVEDLIEYYEEKVLDGVKFKTSGSRGRK